MVFVKKSIFPYLFFRAKKARKKHFLIFWKENKAFGPRKWSSHKLENNRHFAKSMVFVKKSTFFSYVFFLDRKECFLDHKRKVLKNFNKSTFCKKVSPWFFLKNGRFPNLFFWAKKGRRKHFFIFWVVKIAF